MTPTVSTSGTVRFGAKEANALVNGVSEQYFVAKGTKLSQGRFFDSGSVAQKAQDVVIDENTRKSLFADFDGSPIGQVILIGKAGPHRRHHAGAAGRFRFKPKPFTLSALYFRPVSLSRQPVAAQHHGAGE